MKPFDSLTIRGKRYASPELEELAIAALADVAKAEWEKDIFRFILEWINPAPIIELQTSGTTGNPKRLIVQKNRMVASAKMTQKTLRLKENDGVLLTLPVRYVAGKMFVVRAFVLGLNLDYVKPSLNPMADYPGNADFCAMTPPQLRNAIDGKSVSRIRKVIVGGAPVDAATVELLKNIPTEVIETYGMTETLTHVALRPLNGPSASKFFHALDGVSFCQDERGCLVITAPRITQETVTTNDLVELMDSQVFRWLGRADNVINSGGVKIIPEVVELKLVSLLPVDRFFVAGLKDDLLGEKVVLFIEGDFKPPFELFSGRFSSYERPKSICNVQEFVRTESGKINRKETLKRYFS